jgi:hypothetical protein
MKRILSSITGLILLSTPVLTSALDLTSKQVNDMKFEAYIKSLEDPYTVIPTSAYIVDPLSLKHPINWNPKQVKVGSHINFSMHKNADLADLPRGSRISLFIDKKQTANMTTEQLDTYFLEGMSINVMSSTTKNWRIPSFALQNKEDTELIGKPARRYAFTGEGQSKNEQGESILVSIDDTVYQLMYISKPEYFKKDYPAFKKIATSLKLSAENTKQDRPSKSASVANPFLKKQSKASSSASSAAATKKVRNQPRRK